MPMCGIPATLNEPDGSRLAYESMIGAVTLKPLITIHKPKDSSHAASGRVRSDPGTDVWLTRRRQGDPVVSSASADPDMPLLV
jgi:hypothetical protein